MSNQDWRNGWEEVFCILPKVIYTGRPGEFHWSPWFSTLWRREGWQYNMCWGGNPVWVYADENPYVEKSSDANSEWSK